MPFMTNNLAGLLSQPATSAVTPSGYMRGILSPPTNDQSPQYGYRQDGSAKGNGFLGALSRPSGGVSTELTIDTTLGGRKVSMPLLVPTLSSEETNHLLYGGVPTEAIYRKAIDHYLSRTAAGLTPYYSINTDR